MADADKPSWIPVCSAALDGNEMDYVKQCIETGWVSSSGAFVRRFEQEFAAWCGCRFGVACTSGTASLHLTMLAMGIGPGDEVIVPSLTMIASGNVVLYVGAIPVLVDVDPVTGNLDPQRLEAAITPRTKAVMVVHLYGVPCDMEPIYAICNRHSIPIVEDAAEGIGTKWQGKRAGALGLAGCFSFFANKVITTGEGGMVVTDDEELARRAAGFRDQWFVPQRRFYHPETGYNYRVTNLQAALGVAQLERVEQLVQARVDVAARYCEALAGIDELELPVEQWKGGINSHWMMAVRVAGKAAGQRDELVAHLRAQGIDSRTFFVPLHQQPAFQHLPADCPVSQDLSNRGLLLPTGPTLTPTDLDRVSDAVRSFL